MNGDRGSTATELRAQDRFSMFDMTPLDRYCEMRGIESTKKERFGRWWHHGTRSFETKGGFKRRCLELKQWLAAIPRDIDEGVQTVLVVSHGGVLRECFDFDPPNCGFRVFDLLPDGTSIHVVTGQRKTGSFDGIGDSEETPFEVFSVSLCDGRDGYSSKGSPSSDPDLEVNLALDGEEATFVAKESVLRARIHEMVKTGMPSKEYNRYKLSGKFPPPAYGLTSMSSWGARDRLALDIHGYLDQLAAAMSDPSFPSAVRVEVMTYLQDQFEDGAPPPPCWSLLHTHAHTRSTRYGCGPP